MIGKAIIRVFHYLIDRVKHHGTHMEKCAEIPSYRTTPCYHKTHCVTIMEAAFCHILHKLSSIKPERSNV